MTIHPSGSNNTYDHNLWHDKYHKTGSFRTRMVNFLIYEDKQAKKILKRDLMAISFPLLSGRLWNLFILILIFLIFLSFEFIPILVIIITVVVVIILIITPSITICSRIILRISFLIFSFFTWEIFITSIILRIICIIFIVVVFIIFSFTTIYVFSGGTLLSVKLLKRKPGEELNL